MFLNNKCGSKVEQNSLAKTIFTSQQLLVKTALKAGAFSCQCGCSQSTVDTQDAVAADTTTTTNTL